MAEIQFPAGTRPVKLGSGSFQGSVTGTVSLIFTVLSNDRNDDHFSVVNFPSIPTVGTPYHYGNTTRYDYRAKRYSPKPVSNFASHSRIWEVEVSYDNTINAENAPDPRETDPFTVSMSTETVQRVMEIDLDGYLVTNSAGQKFDNPPMEDWLYPVFTFSRTEYVNPCRKVVDFNRRVNSVEFWGYGPGQILIRDIRPTASINYGMPSWNLQYEVAINMEGSGWDLDILDAGHYERVQTSTSSEGQVGLVPIRDKNGMEVREPQLLNGAGRLLPEGSDPVWLWFRKRYTADLNLLRLPNPFLI